MTLTIELTPEEEMQVAQHASAQGLTPADYMRRVIRVEIEGTRQQQKNQAAMELLQSWIDEAQNIPEEERQQADAEWRAAMRDLDDHRFSSRRLFPELAATADNHVAGKAA